MLLSRFALPCLLLVVLLAALLLAVLLALLLIVLRVGLWSLLALLAYVSTRSDKVGTILGNGRICPVFPAVSVPCFQGVYTLYLNTI